MNATDVFPYDSESSLGVRPHRSRIMVVDDHPLVCNALASLISLQPDLMICAEATDPATATGLLARTQPELIVTDFTMPGRDGIEFIKDIWAFNPQIRILIFTMHEENHYAERSLRAGASGFIMKNAGPSALLGAIRNVLSGGISVSPKMSTQILGRFAGPSGRNNHSSIEQLSDREFEIFLLTGEGRDAMEIANKLRISRKTVDVHRGKIKKKLHLFSSTALTCQAVQWVENEMSKGA